MSTSARHVEDYCQCKAGRTQTGWGLVYQQSSCWQIQLLFYSCIDKATSNTQQKVILLRVIVVENRYSCWISIWLNFTFEERSETKRWQLSFCLVGWNCSVQCCSTVPSHCTAGMYFCACAQVGWDVNFHLDRSRTMCINLKYEFYQNM